MKLHRQIADPLGGCAPTRRGVEGVHFAIPQRETRGGVPIRIGGVPDALADVISELGNDCRAQIDAVDCGTHRARFQRFQQRIPSEPIVGTGPVSLRMASCTRRILQPSKSQARLRHYSQRNGWET